MQQTPPPPGVKIYLTGAAPLVSEMQHSGQQIHCEDHRGSRRDNLRCCCCCLPIDHHRNSAVGHGGDRIARRPGESSRSSAISIFSCSRRLPPICWCPSRWRPEPTTGYFSSVGIRRRVRPARTARTAYYTAYRGVAPVVLASGLTIAGAMLCLSFTRLPYFQSLGVPCAVGMLVTVAVAVTLVPAVIAVGAVSGCSIPSAGSGLSMAPGRYRDRPLARADSGWRLRHRADGSVSAAGI